MLVAATTPTPDKAPASVGAQAATPIERAVDKFVGLTAVRANFGDLGHHDMMLGGLAGAREGYETLGEALTSGSAIARSALKLKGDTLTGASFAVVNVEDRFALMNFTDLLAIRYRGDNYRPIDYKTHKNEAGSAVAAVIDGFGNLVRPDGKVGWG